jgi:SAM-dependent methyltransferase
MTRTFKVGIESEKSYDRKSVDGFWTKYLGGPRILDIGFKGHVEGHGPIVPDAIGIDLDYPGYDGITLPFPDQSVDAIYTSHCLEHIADEVGVLRDWFRVTRTGGHIIIVVPHAYLYERKLTIPHSQWNGDHKRSYTPASLTAAVEKALVPNSYRVRHLCDNDLDYDYGRMPDEHPHGCYEIELVIQRIAPPVWMVGA